MDKDKFRLVVAIMIGAFLIFLAIMMVQKNDREKEMLQLEQRKVPLSF